jgi:phosphate transport system ATP-binding protein
MRIGMVFQKPNPFPKSIYENVAYGLRVRGMKTSELVIDDKVERAARAPRCGTRSRIACRSWRANLSGGQQQRLCIARALATTRNCSCSTSRPRRSTRSPPAQHRGTGA